MINNIVDEIENESSKIRNLELDIGLNFEKLESKVGNFVATSYQKQTEELHLEIESIKDDVRRLNREFEYIEDKLNNLNDARIDLSKKISLIVLNS